MRYASASVLIVSLLVAVAGCGSSSDTAASTTAPAVASSASSPAADTGLTTSSSASPGAAASGSGSASGADATCETIAAKYASLKGTQVIVGSSPGAGNYNIADEQDPNKIVGIEPDLYDAVSKCVGFDWTLQKQDFGGLIPALQAGQITMISSGMYASDERAAQINFVQYMKAGESAMVKQGNPKNLTSVDSLCGVTAAQVVGTVENAIFDKASADCEAAGKPAIVALSFQDNSQAVNAVAQDRADIFMTDSGVAGYLAGKFPDLQVAFPIVSEFVFGFGFAKENSELTNAFQDALTVFYNNGELENMIVKWGFDPSQVFEPAIKS